MPTVQRTVGNSQLVGGSASNNTNYGPLLATDNGDGTFTLTTALGASSQGATSTTPTYEATTGEVRETAVGTITTDSGLGYPSGAGIVGVPAAGSFVLLNPVYNHSGWSLLINGAPTTGSLCTEATSDDPTSPTARWVGIQARASNSGRLYNQYQQTGLQRGVFADVRGLRVRAFTTTYGTGIGAFTGSCPVILTAGAPGPTFQNSDVLVQSMEQYQAASSGLNCSYGVAVDTQTFTAPATAVNLLSITNTDAAGGRVIYLNRIVVGINANITTATAQNLRRYAGAVTPSAGTVATPVNRAHTATPLSGPSCASVRYGTATVALTITGSGTLEKTLTCGDNLNDASVENGSYIIPPGQTTYFTFQSTAASPLVSVELVWWEGTVL